MTTRTPVIAEPAAPLSHEGPTRPAAAIVLAVVLAACSVYANLALLVTNKADYRFFPPFQRYVNDNSNDHLGGEYFNMARSLVAGDGYAHPFDQPTGPTAWQPPVLPTFLAGLLWACRGNRDAVMAVVVFLQVHVLIATGLLVLRLAPRRLGPGVAAAVFLVGVLGEFSLCFQSTHDYWLVLAAVDLLIVGFCWSRPLRRWPGAAGWGLFGGLAGQVNPVLALFWGAGSFLVAARDGAWSRFAVAVLVALLALTPWTVRNYRVFGRLIPIKSNAAYELYQSQCLQPDGLIQSSTFLSHPYGANTRERREYIERGEIAFLDHKAEQFREAVRASPQDFLDRVCDRFLGATLWYTPFDRARAAKSPWLLGMNRLLHALPFLGFLVLAATSLWRRLDWPQWIVLAIYVLYLSPYIAISYYERYAIPLLGVKALLVIWAVDRLQPLWRAGGVSPRRKTSLTLTQRTRPSHSRPPCVIRASSFVILSSFVIRHSSFSHACPPPPRPRRAFTLVELLVVIGIIGVALALLFPAVQRSREASARLRCAANLREIGLGLHHFHETFAVFPSNGGWDGQQKIPSASGTPFVPSTLDHTTGQTYQWGVGDPALGPRDQTGSWAFSLLPYVEQQQVYQQRAWTSAVPLYVCPMRRRPTAEPAVADAYGQYQGGGWTWGKTDYAVNLEAFDNRPACRSMDTFTDGLSTTILVGEKAFNPRVEQPTSWYWDEPFFLGGSKGTSRGGLGLLQDGPGLWLQNGVWVGDWSANPYKENWGSAHPGGVQFLFGDGAVQLLVRATDLETFSALLTPDGGEPVSRP